MTGEEDRQNQQRGDKMAFGGESQTQYEISS
jgi:hypothetical protein